MVDYGQALQFGTFLTPDASDPQRVVELALLTEAAGLELATIQDHPYQARFLDAYALARHDPGAHLDPAGRRERDQPAAALPLRAGQDRGVAGPAQPRADRARHRRRGVLGRDRGGRRVRGAPRARRSRRSRRASRSSGARGTPSSGR